MNTPHVGEILGLLKRIAAALEGTSNGAAPGVSASIPVNPYESVVPAGYDTVLGFLSKDHPEVLDLMEDPISGTARDGLWLTHRAHRRGIGVVEVEAPQIAKDCGIDKLNAYPVSLLRERLAA